MEQYIDKAEVVAEIERKKAYAQYFGDNAINSSMQQFYDGMREGCNNLLSFINTLEVKEVDLDKEIELIKGDYEQVDVAWNNDFDFIAKHFFELGLKAQKGDKL